MAMSIAAATSSHLPWILLDEDAYIGSLRNNTTAVVIGRDFLTIEASLWPAQPPLPTKLFVHCPGAAYPHPSKIITTAQDLLLFRVPVAVGPPPDFIKLKDCDYILYRAGGIPSLTLIPNPREPLYDGEVGVLPRTGDGDLFTVAALVGTPAENEYTLHRFDSEVGDWTLKTLCLEAPRKAFPVKIPTSALRVNHHITTTVITLGGEAGTMGWVDLWSGILLYDLFPVDPESAVLRHMQLPLPMHCLTSRRRVMELGCPRSSRGIAAVAKDGKPCLKLADLQIIEDHLPYNDIETDLPCSVVEDWAVTIWGNPEMCYPDSFKGWQEDFTVWASEIKISDTVRSELLSSGLLHREPSADGEERVELALQNLVVSEPKPSLNGEKDIVYLMARPKRFLPKAWALTVDINNKTLLGVAKFCTNKPCGSPGTATSTISNYMNPMTPPVNYLLH